MKFALIGDIHGFWNRKDTEYFNASDYDALFFTGDLGRTRILGPLLPKYDLSDLTKKAYLIPGNWDGTSITGILGEVLNQNLLKRVGSIGYAGRMKTFAQAVRPIPVMGYSTAVLSEEKDLALVVGRPHSMGNGLNFRKNLSEHYLITSMEESTIKLKKLIDSIKQENIFFLSHNGLKGLGAEKNSIYGADFLANGGDYGDEDLTAAITYAKAIGKKVPAVLSGHMHHYLPSLKKERESLVYSGGTFYINGAKVPRIKRGKHFHTKIEWNGSSVNAIQLWENL